MWFVIFIPKLSTLQYAYFQTCIQDVRYHVRISSFFRRNQQLRQRKTGYIWKKQDRLPPLLVTRYWDVSEKNHNTSEKPEKVHKRLTVLCNSPFKSWIIYTHDNSIINCTLNIFFQFLVPWRCPRTQLGWIPYRQELLARPPFEIFLVPLLQTPSFATSWVRLRTRLWREYITEELGANSTLHMYASLCFSHLLLLFQTSFKDFEHA